MLRKQIFTCGRLALRAAVANVIDGQAIPTWPNCHPEPSVAPRHYSTNVPKEAPTPPLPSPPRVVSTCCGFPKDMVHGPSKVQDPGVVGEDACFIARYKQTHVVGVADGVGGWRKYGIDPSEFSSGLMKRCSDLVQSGEFTASRPDLLIAKAFQQLAATPPRPIGSSTACVIVIEQNTLYSANLGDSGYLVMRNGRVFYRSNEQTHYFNAPFQLCLLPEEAEGSQGFIGDAPEKADLADLKVETGDLIVLATDGLWDNVNEQMIVEQLADVRPDNIQSKCNGLALTARRLAFDSSYASPFAKKARLEGIHAPGGKPDDITILLILVAGGEESTP